MMGAQEQSPSKRRSCSGRMRTSVQSKIHFFVFAHTPWLGKSCLAQIRICWWCLALFWLARGGLASLILGKGRGDWPRPWHRQMQRKTRWQQASCEELGHHHHPQAATLQVWMHHQLDQEHDALGELQVWPEALQKHLGGLQGVFCRPLWMDDPGHCQVLSPWLRSLGQQVHLHLHPH